MSLQQGTLRETSGGRTHVRALHPRRSRAHNGALAINGFYDTFGPYQRRVSQTP